MNDAILNLNGLFKRVVFHHIEDGGKGLVLYNGHVIGGLCNGGLYVAPGFIPGALEYATGNDDAPTLGDDIL